MISVLRTFLNVGRASNLPTVLSNCLAGWWLGGAGHPERLPWLLVGATQLYLGGAFLNDASDVAFDRQHRRGRPIPSGAIAFDTVRAWGFALLGLGAICLALQGALPGILSLALVSCIFLYNAVHRLILFSPVLLGLCRLVLYVIAASTFSDGIAGRAIWCGLAVASYVAGIGYLFPRERMHGPWSYGLVFCLLTPIVLALIMNADGYLENALLISAVLGLWILQCLRYTFWSSEPEPLRTTRRLVAGITLVDWLAVSDAPRAVATLFLLLFAATLALQQWENP